MKDKEPQRNKLDEQAIAAAATAAVQDLELDTEVKSVNADGDKWCVQFATEYRQFCDTFRDQFDKENSFELIREKIKRHILKHQQNKIRSNVRIRRGKTTESRSSSDNFLESAVKTITGAVGQTAGVAGEIINQASSLPEQALEALTGAAESIGTASNPPLQSAQSVEQPLMRVRVKTTSSKPTKKSSRSAHKAATKKSRAAKKSASKSASKKASASAKSTSKSAQKRGSKKARTK